MGPESGPVLEPCSIGTTPKAENGAELVLGVQNLDTDREIPSNATSSSLDAAG